MKRQIYSNVCWNFVFIFAKPIFQAHAHLQSLQLLEDRLRRVEITTEIVGGGAGCCGWSTMIFGVQVFWCSTIFLVPEKDSWRQIAIDGVHYAIIIFRHVCIGLKDANCA
jgi:hypothetical protein